MQSITIENKIYEIRGQNPASLFDLAALYEVETRVLNQAIKRNMESFPDDFMFRLSEEEWNTIFPNTLKNTEGKPASNMTSQNVISCWGGRRKLPYAFTEHGVTMLASLLKSTKARQMNIAIVRAFIALRQFAVNNKDLADQIKQLMQKQGNVDGQLDKIYEALENLLDNQTDQQIQKELWKNRPRIGFKKQH